MSLKLVGIVRCEKKNRYFVFVFALDYYRIIVSYLLIKVFCVPELLHQLCSW